MMRGQRWLQTAGYLTQDDRDKIMRVVEQCREAHPEHARTVGVRAASYIGEPHPIAAVTYGPGGSSLYRSVYREADHG